MRSAAQRLVNQCRAPVMLPASGNALEAYRALREVRVSHLTVVDENGRLTGVISADSLLSATSLSGIALDSIPLAAVVEPPRRTFDAIPVITELLQALQEQGAVVFVDEHQRPQHLVTLQDAAEFLRVRAQELLWLDNRNSAREQQGLVFFQRLTERLAGCNLPPLAPQHSPDGRRLILLQARHAPIALTLGFSFTTQRTSRIELHMDGPTPAVSKRFFDALVAERNLLEARAGTAFQWERQESARGCRVALYNQTFISQNEVAVKRLESWASLWTSVFLRVLWPRALELARTSGEGLPAGERSQAPLGEPRTGAASCAAAAHSGRSERRSK